MIELKVAGAAQLQRESKESCSQSELNQIAMGYKPLSSQQSQSNAVNAAYLPTAQGKLYLKKDSMAL